MQYDSNEVLFSVASDGTHVLTTLLSRDAGSGDSSTHLATVRAGESPTFLTGPGLWEVTDIVGHYEQHM